MLSVIFSIDYETLAIEDSFANMAIFLLQNNHIIRLRLVPD